MAIRPDIKINPPDEIIVAEAWMDTIGGVTRDEIVMEVGVHPEAWLQELRDGGWTLTRYTKVSDG